MATGPDEPTIDKKFARVEEALRSSTARSTPATIIDIRRSDDTAVVHFEWPMEPKPLGLVIDLVDTTKEFYYGEPVADFQEWLEYLDVYVMVFLDTGGVSWGKREDRGDYVAIFDIGRKKFSKG